MAETAKLAADAETLRANIEAERRAAQNAAANDKITFDDEYLQTENGHMRYWVVCMAGGKDACLTAITSKMWNRKFKDLGALKTKYKCMVCNANYKTSWGVFVEITIDGKIYGLRSELPDDDTLDIKAMDLERKHKDASTAQALYDPIPMIAPTETEYVKCIDVEKGHYRLSFSDDEKTFSDVETASSYMGMPLSSWSDILTFSPA